MTTTDALGRRLPTNTELLPTDPHIRITALDLDDLEVLDIHGKLPSTFLIELSDGYHGKRSHRLGELRRAGYITCPDAQFHPIYTPRNQQLVYALAPKGIEALIRAGRYRGIKHDGWYVHQVMTACITASLQLGCQKHGYRFIDQHEITDDLCIPKVPFNFTVKTPRRKEKEVVVSGEIDLNPDAVVGIDYGTRKRYFLIEADRQNEPNVSTDPTKKTHLRSFSQYRNAIGEGLYKKAYGLKDGSGLLLYVTISSLAKQNLRKTLGLLSKANNYTLFHSLDGFETAFNPPKPFDLSKGERLGHPDLSIFEP